MTKRPSYISPGLIRVSSETIEALRKMGMDLKPVSFPLFEISETKIQPLKRVKERRFDFIKRANDLAKAEIDKDVSRETLRKSDE